MFIALRLITFTCALLLFRESIINLLDTAVSPDKPTYFLENFRKFISITPRETPILELLVIAIYIFFEVFTKKHLRTVMSFLYFSLIGFTIASIFSEQFALIDFEVLGWQLNYLQFFSGIVLITSLLYVLLINFKIIKIFINICNNIYKLIKKIKEIIFNNEDVYKRNSSKCFVIDEALTENNYNNQAGEQLANELCEHILGTSNNQSSFGIGIEGEWGTGKTSFIRKLEKIALGKGLVITHFKPYLLTDTRSFEKELMKNIAEQFKSPILNDMLSDYWKAFEKVSSPLWQFFYILFNRDETIHKQYEKISQRLQIKSKKLVIIIDDIDRLDSGALRILLKLVKQIASFPHLFFVFAYDQAIIKKRLEKLDSDQKTFLEKIITFNFSLPQIPSFKLKSIFEKLQEEYLQESQMINNFSLVSKGYKELFLNPRSIKRVINHYKISWNLFEKVIYTNLSEAERQLINKQLFILSILHTNFYSIYFDLRNGSRSIYEAMGSDEAHARSSKEPVVIYRSSDQINNIIRINEIFIKNQKTIILQELLNVLNEFNKSHKYLFISKEYQNIYLNFELDSSDIDPIQVKENMEALNDIFEG